jgi:hypothetical protein
VVQGPRTSMVRPHPAVWRLVHGAAVLYVMALVWMLHQTVDTARQALKVSKRPCFPPDMQCSWPHSLLLLPLPLPLPPLPAVLPPTHPPN